MPLYEYECPACGAQTEVLKKVEDRDKCPRCQFCEIAMSRIQELVCGAFPGADTWQWQSSQAKLNFNDGRSESFTIRNPRTKLDGGSNDQ